MFSLNHPEILSHLGKLAYGYQPVRMPDGSFSLIVKAGKEIILTARLNNGFKIYLVPDVTTPGQSLGFISAFFDDHDEPLVMFTPLYGGDALLFDLAKTLTQDRLKLLFFDEHDRELLGAVSCLEEVTRFRQALARTAFPPLNLDALGATYMAMQDWFGRRTSEDDARAFTVVLGERLYPDDLVIIDARDGAYASQCSDDLVISTSLEREEPGPFQEQDIVALMRRVFPAEAIFLNPVRDDTSKELTDVLVVTNEIVLLVQAKDSPNTEASLRRSIDRKRSVIRDHIDKGARQLRGALSYCLERNEIVLRTASGPRTVQVGDRSICGLVVVREMFDDDYKACSAPVLAVANVCRRPCILLDYPALHLMALRLLSPLSLVNGFYQLFDMALERGEYPKPVFFGLPIPDADTEERGESPPCP
jgi:hypothetical protein